MNIEFFYCYNPALKTYIIKNGIKYNGIGINPNSNKKYWMFQQTDHLSECIENYKSKNV